MAIAIHRDGILTELRPGNAPKWNLPEGKPIPNYFDIKDSEIKKYIPFLGLELPINGPNPRLPTDKELSQL